MSIINNRLAALRKVMEKEGVDAWYISGTDPHSSEYLPERWQTRRFISGFTGSYGIVVVTKSKAGLWTDSRYFIQAEDELKGTGITMFKLRVPDAVSPEEWLVDNLISGERVGIDSQSVSVSQFRSLKSSMAKKNIEVVALSDLLDKIWKDRPLPVTDKVFELDIKYSGLSRKEKQKQVAARLLETGASFQVVSMLDELAWLYNLRGSDIDYNPVFTGFGLIGANSSYLFVDKIKLTDKLSSKLENEGIILKEYNEFYDFLNGLNDNRILIDPNTANYSVYRMLAGKNEIIEDTSVIALLKAVKNSTEIDGFRNAMKRDGVAMVEFHYWLKNNAGKPGVTEFVAGRKLREFRAAQDKFTGESFPPIVGYKEHGAIVHLSVDEENALPLETEGMLLFDSGAQYIDGTTDITRTVALGEITEQQKLDFTYVLKGNINLALAKFPYGTRGCNIDILARTALWQNGLNYGHGTGHGVGHFLNVHEGPQSIRQELNDIALMPGMVTSNEPAFYRNGEYGIRTENMMVCIELEKTEFGQFLGFETLTLCPVDTTLIKKELLTKDETDWLNNYHKRVNKELKPLLRKELHAFLDEMTKEI